MSTPPHDPNQPLGSDSGITAHFDAARMQEPVVLVIAGQTIRAESADAPVLYEMNRGVANLGHATTTVQLSRVESAVAAAKSTETAVLEEDEELVDAGSEEVQTEEEEVAVAVSPSRVKIRKHHIFDLVHPTSRVGDAPAFYVKPRSRTTHAGVWGLKKTQPPLLRTQWRALAADPKGLRYDGGKAKKPLFQVTKSKNGGYEWKDEKGEPLAVEERSGSGKREKREKDEDEEEVVYYRLKTARSMERTLLDALVAMWCCRVWEESAEKQPQVHSGVQRGMSQSFLLKI
ncbi:hypothetical protein PWT90_00363 [Aphanocladium album]|nr:hypothetical protein PWT90_00363 [Aphanocladium album]